VLVNRTVLDKMPCCLGLHHWPKTQCKLLAGFAVLDGLICWLCCNARWPFWPNNLL